MNLKYWTCTTCYIHKYNMQPSDKTLYSQRTATFPRNSLLNCGLQRRVLSFYQSDILKMIHTSGWKSN